MVPLVKRGLTIVLKNGGLRTLMCKSRLTWLASSWAIAISLQLASAQSGATSGLYEILSGSYAACCGIAGELLLSLPNESQSFVRLTVDPQTALATMSFLGSDRRTVWSVVPCQPGGSIQFRFDYGFSLSNSIIFQADPGPPPYATYWHYGVSNSANSLQINGTLGTAQQGCADVPTLFSHSNVVARLVAGPSLSISEFSKEGALIFVQGHAGWTNVIEASTDLVSWMAICTNLMPTTDCPACPYILFRDAASTNLASRYYRCFER